MIANSALVCPPLHAEICKTSSMWLGCLVSVVYHHLYRFKDFKLLWTHFAGFETARVFSVIWSELPEEGKQYFLAECTRRGLKYHFFELLIHEMKNNKHGKQQAHETRSGSSLTAHLCNAPQQQQRLKKKCSIDGMLSRSWKDYLAEQSTFNNHGTINAPTSQ